MQSWGSVLPAGNRLPSTRWFSADFVINHRAQENGQENESWAPHGSSGASADSLCCKFFVLFNAVLGELGWTEFYFPFYGDITFASAHPTLSTLQKSEKME